MSNLLSASLRGALTGLLYGLAEYAVVVLEPMLRWGPRAIGPEHWSWEAAFLAAYIVLGALTGAVLSALPIPDPVLAAPRTVLALIAIAELAGRLRFTGLAPVALIPGLAFALLALFLLWASLRPKAEFAIWLSSPPFAILLFFAILRAATLFTNPITLATAIFALTLATLAAAFLIFRAAPLRRLLDRRFIPLTAVSCTLLLFAWIAATLRLDAASPAIPAFPASAGATRPPNVLFIVFDTVRADHLSLYGYSRHNTPHLEALAKESILYRNAVSAADMTLSSYGSLFTGLYPSWHGALPNPTDKINRLDPSFTTLAESLSARGYATLGVHANHGYLNRDFGMQQGFRYYDVAPSARPLGTHKVYWPRTAVRSLFDLFTNTTELDRPTRRADQITASALRVLRSPSLRSTPFFLSLNYMDAHTPYAVPAPYRDLFPGRDPRFHEDAGMTATRDHQLSQYDAAIAYLDAQVPLLLDVLKQQGLYDNTLIIVTADHGEAFGEHGDTGHPASVHQELVHVPLLIKYPRSLSPAPGTQIDATASGVDLMPTILEVAGASLPPNLQGRSLLSLPSAPARSVISESFVDAHLAQNHRRSDSGQRALYRDHWKFIATSNRPSEFYDWIADPAETLNLTAAHPAARPLHDELIEWLHNAPRQKKSTQKLSPETTDRLRGLGYIR
jgi:arylsulfatase A-like enzyme